MKLLIIKNQYKGKVNIDKYLKWFNDNKLFNVEYEVIETDIPVETFIVHNDTFNGVIANPDKLRIELKKIIPEKKYHVVAIYNENLNGIRVSWTSGDFYPDTELVQLRTITDNGKDLNHEIFHVMAFRANKRQFIINDVMDTYFNNDVFDLKADTNRTRQLNLLKPYLSKIWDFRDIESLYNKSNDSSWKYFKLSEKTGELPHTIADLDKKLVDKLDTVRGLCGFPFVITSGYRTIEENSIVGGVAGSSHVKRLAVDIFCTDSSKRIKIIENALNNGFIGIGIDKSFIHLDIDTEYTKRIWLY